MNYATSTLLLYRRILRTFRAFAVAHPHPALRAERPSDVNRGLVKEFIHQVNCRRASWSWIASNIAVLRTIFDKLAGFTVTATLLTPKRPWRLPEILSPDEVVALVRSAGTLRDRLIIGMFYGCGLKVGELCTLRWQDVNIGARSLTIRYNRDTKVRNVPIPDAILDILKLGTEKCPPADYIFPGAVCGKPLSARLIERLVRKIAESARIDKPVTCMILRHSYAVDCLRRGMSVVELQKNLGHRSLATTMEYQRFILPETGNKERSSDGPPSPVNQPDPLLSLKTDASAILSALPFPALTSGACEFLVLLKTRIRDRFLALRSFISNSS